MVGTWGRVSKLLKDVDTRRIRAENKCTHMHNEQSREKYLIDVAIGDGKK